MAVHDGEPFAGPRTGAQDDLAVGEATLRDELVEQRMGHEARRHGDDVVAAPMPEPESAVDGDASQRGAVAGGGQLRAQAHLDVEVSLAAQRVRERSRP